MKRIVISGGPSSGKTTIINELKRAGHYCFDEVSRELILEAQKKGIAQPFLTDPEQFNNCLLYTSPSPRDGLLSRMPSSA